jgi:hypothetical protein
MTGINLCIIPSLDKFDVTLYQIKHSSRRFFKRLDVDEKAIPNLIKNEMSMLESYGWVTLVEEKFNACAWAITPSLKTSFMKGVFN